MFEYVTTAKASLVLRFGFEGMTHAPMISFPATDSRSDSGERQWTVNAELLTDCLSWETQSSPKLLRPEYASQEPELWWGRLFSAPPKLPPWATGPSAPELPNIARHTKRWPGRLTPTKTQSPEEGSEADVSELIIGIAGAGSSDRARIVGGRRSRAGDSRPL